ncbi:MAG: beta-N-acetylhexosaminidase [Clostridia bacterium]|nr:beta-N-acetylhexosaminidase [Clostridia bacterium]
MNYKYFGVMLDCSRNAVMKVSEVKKMIDVLAKMGYNALELYTEDTFKVEGEPYFGYLRGGYTAEEIKEIDAYAKTKGIELIPCIQTLAHFTNLVKLRNYKKIVDVNDILLIDEEKTYELIDKMFLTLSKNFTSRVVNIGMDEAHMVGLGKFLDKHGYHNRFDILLRHLNKVIEIATKYGFKAHMWSDMFFRLINNGEYYGENLRIPEEVTSKMPNVDLVYWDYYHSFKPSYDDMLKSHQATGKEIWFAGGVWTWTGFVPLNYYTLRTMKSAMQSVKEHGITNVLMTLWGDDGKECSFYALLPSLYAIKCYADGIENEEEIKSGFYKLFGVNYDDFMLLDSLNYTANAKKFDYDPIPSKSLLYSDCFMNSNDYFGIEAYDMDYATCTKNLEDAAKRAGEYAYIFNSMASLSRCLEIKATLSIRTRTAYKNGDKQELKNIVCDYDKLDVLLNDFHQKFYKLWHTENKPFGWEVQDARLGGVIMRAKTCKAKIQSYLNGEIDKIEELEVELLPLTSNPFETYIYKRLVSVSEI